HCFPTRRSSDLYEHRKVVERAQLRARQKVKALDDDMRGVDDALDVRLPAVRDEVVDRLVEGRAVPRQLEMAAQQRMLLGLGGVEIVRGGVEVRKARGAAVVIVFGDDDSACAQAARKRLRNRGLAGAGAAGDGDD